MIKDIKLLESQFDEKVPEKSVIVVRVDGVGFTKLLHPYKKKAAFDSDHREAMILAAVETIKRMSGFLVAYVCSDEISFIMTDMLNEKAQHWFGGRIQKLCSVIPSSVSVVYSTLMSSYKGKLITGIFDAKVIDLYYGWNPEKYINNRLFNNLNNQTLQLHTFHFGAKKSQGLSLHRAQESLFEKEITCDKDFLYGTLIIKDSGQFQRICPFDIGVGNIGGLISHLVEKKVDEYETKRNSSKSS